MPLAASSSIQVPEKSGFWAKATAATANIATAMTPIRARFMRCSFVKMMDVTALAYDALRLPVQLFEPKRFDWVKPGRFLGRIKPEKHTRPRREPECHADRVGGDRGRPL